MPEIKKTFLRGRMNKDLDERLIPDGEYRDASNIQISSTESDDSGTVQNILGNQIKWSHSLGGECVGLIENPETEKIYIFLKGTSAHGIFEFNQSTGVTRPVVVDNRDVKVLDFTNITKITGITILNDFLIFTDNNSEPKIINISDTSNFLTDSDYSATTFDTTSKLNGERFVEADITLITKKPDKPPGVEIELPSVTKREDAIYKDKFVRFAYRFKFKNNQCSPISPFTQPIFLPNATNSYDINSGFNNQMENNITKAKLFGFDTSNNNLKSIEIIYKESNNTNLYIYGVLSKAEADAANIHPTGGFDVSKPVKKSVLPDNELFRTYDNVPYRAKAVDVVGNRIVFGNYKDGLTINDFTPSFDFVNLVDRGKVNEESTRDFSPTVIGDTVDGVNDLAYDTSLYDTRTVKSGREYEIGIVFEDAFGRQSPVITAGGGDNSGTIEEDFAINQYGKKFNIKMTGDVPLGAYKDNVKVNADNSINEKGSGRIKKYKYYIKSSSNKYDNFITETAREDKEEAGTCWLVVPSYEINKVKEGEYIMLKKALNSNDRLVYSSTTLKPTDYKFKILDISKDKPLNIDSPETFDGKFFIKIKKTDIIDTHFFANQGTAGKSTLIERGTEHWKEVDEDDGAVPAQALFLGQAFLPERGEESHVEYYFQNGVIYELARSSTVEMFNTFTTSVNQIGSRSTSPTNGVSTQYTFDHTAGDTGSGSSDFEIIPDSGKLSGWTGDYTDTGNFIVTDVWVQIDSNNFATAFYMKYNTENTISVTSSPAVFETIPEEEVLDVYYETSEVFNIENWGGTDELSWNNAYVMGNGVESSVINDDYLEDRIASGIRVSTTIEEDYSERTQKSSLIYSGILNSESGVNKLNDFNPALKITKELNPEYGSIQKLHTRNTDIIALCEDKILRVMANKDALFNADGNVNLVATENVLNTAIPFNGEYGISKNPESFASHGYYSYFVDKARGAVIRLLGTNTNTGLSIISDKGMSSFFRDSLPNESGLIQGSYDIYSDQYILSLNSYGSSITFKEDVDGWVSRLSFLPDNGVSLNGEYYTCYNGQLYLHHVASRPRNTFYDIFSPSGIKLILNQDASAIKNFKNLSYEGTTGWATETDQKDIINTDLQDGQILEFVEKEGKYFGLISGIDTKLDEQSNELTGAELSSRLKDFSIQGLGSISSFGGSIVFSCADANFSVSNSATGTTVSGIASVSSGTIVSITPSTLASGVSEYSATILVPAGFANTGSNITCIANATGTDTNVEFTEAIANLSINSGIVGASVTGSVSVGTIASFSPATYSLGTNNYTATINIPVSGYTNSGTITVTKSAVASLGSCDFSLAVGSYNTDNYTLTGTFSGTDYGNSDTIKLEVDSGNIGIGSAGGSNTVNTTKSALAGQLTIYSNQSVNITATVTSGLCSQIPATATIQAPQSAAVIISGASTAFLGDNITLTANTTGNVNSYQWHKSTSSGFTPASGNAVAGETNATLITTETTADTIYYKVVINGTTASTNEHNIVWSAWTTHSNLKYISGTSRNGAACTSTDTRNLFGNGSFTAATRFATSNLGSTTNFEEGTYSDGTNNRFISGLGIPQTHAACSDPGGNMGIRASSCDNANNDKFFFVDLDTFTASDLAVGKVVSFTNESGGGLVAQFGKNYWVVEAINLELDSSQYDATPFLRTVANSGSCLSLNPPTVSLAVSESSVFAGEQVTLTATPSFTPQGATLTYIYRKSTDGSTPSTIVATTTSTTATDNVQTTAGTNKYTVEIQGTSPLIISSPTTDVTVSQYVSVANTFASGNTINSDACTAASNTAKAVFAKSSTLTNAITNLFTSAAGATNGFDMEGTYSNGTIHALFNSTGVRQNNWVACDTTASPSVTINFGGSSTDKLNRNPYEALELIVTPSNFAAGTNPSYVWKQTAGTYASGVSASTVLSTQDRFTAALTSSEASGLATGATISKTFQCEGTSDIDSSIHPEDTITISWQGVEQQLVVESCTGNNVEYVKVKNSNGYSSGEVINIEGSAIDDGCYKINTANHTGHESYDDVLVAGNHPFSASANCCACSSCSATITALSGVTDGKATSGTNVELSATPSGYSVNTSGDKYDWFVSFTSINGPWTPIPSMHDDATPLVTVPADQASTAYYKVTITGFNETTTGVTRDGTFEIDWELPGSDNKTYKLKKLNNDATTNADTCSEVAGFFFANASDDSGLGGFTGVGASSQTYSAGSILSRIDGENTCFKIVGVESTYVSGYPQIAEFYNDCKDCYDQLTYDCTLNMTVSNTYDALSGTAVFTLTIGTTALDGDSVSLTPSNSNYTVSPTTTTVGALKAGLTVTMDPGKILNATVTSGGCTGVTTSRQSPTTTAGAACHLVNTYVTTINPASDTAGGQALCYGTKTKATRMNASSLASATQIYSDQNCTTLLSGTKYFTEDQTNYYIWNGYSLSSAIPLNCSSIPAP
jgi:hypothetical protein